MYGDKAMYGEAVAELQTAVKPWGTSESMAWLGRADGIAGDREKAEKILHKLDEISKQRFVPSNDISRVHLGLGDDDQALTWSYHEHSGWMAYMNVDPSLFLLRDDPRFQDILRRMKFPK